MLELLGWIIGGSIASLGLYAVYRTVRNTHVRRREGKDSEGYISIPLKDYYIFDED